MARWGEVCRWHICLSSRESVGEVSLNHSCEDEFKDELTLPLFLHITHLIRRNLWTKADVCLFTDMLKYMHTPTLVCSVEHPLSRKQRGRGAGSFHNLSPTCKLPLHLHFDPTPTSILTLLGGKGHTQNTVYIVFYNITVTYINIISVQLFDRHVHSKWLDWAYKTSRDKKSGRKHWKQSAMQGNVIV